MSNMMKESRNKSDRLSKSSSVSSFPLILDIDDFKGEFSFDSLFGNLVNELLPSFQEEETDSSEGHSNLSGNDSLQNRHMRVPSDAAKFAQGLLDPLFPEVDKILSLFKDFCKELVDINDVLLQLQQSGEIQFDLTANQIKAIALESWKMDRTRLDLRFHHHSGST